MKTRKQRRLRLDRITRATNELHYLWTAYPNATGYRGINYAGFQAVNIDKSTWIRYGVIPQNAVGEAWYEVDMDYGPATCPKCGNDAVSIDDEGVPDLDQLEAHAEDDFDDCPGCGNYDGDVADLNEPQPEHMLGCPNDDEAWDDCGRDYACLGCKYSFDSEYAWHMDAEGTPYVDDGEYKAFGDSHGDIIVTLSPYFTRAQFCSPCAPGACYLTKPCPNGEKAYCLGHEWFEGDVAPYPVWSVATGKLVKPKR